MSRLPWTPPHWWTALKKGWLLYHLGDPAFRFMFDPAPPDEWVALDCETTGLNVRSDEIVSIGAVRIVGQRIMTSERLELLVRPQRAVSGDSIRIHRLRERDLVQGIPAEEAVRKLMHFIGSRPIVGYFLEFDMAMLHRVVWPILGQGLPQPRIEVSSLYYRYKFNQLPPYQQYASADIDLHFSTILQDLGMPVREAHNAVNDAVMAALAFIKLRQLQVV